MRFRFIEQHRREYAIALQCRVLEVSASGYYAWRIRPERTRTQQNRHLSVQIRAVFETHRHRYGSPRIHDELREQGIRVSRQRVARLMRRECLRARAPRRFKRTTDSAHAHPIAPNRLEWRFAVEQVAGPNRVWLGDITYLATKEGWLYLAVLLDLHSRRVVGWALATTLEQSLPRQALNRALALRQPGAGLLHHSDRGSQYAATDYQDQMDRHGMVCSMSRKGDCWDNAPVESFFATLKGELVSEFNGVFASREQAQQEVGTYIESYYNSVRRHSALGYLSPAAFEQKHRSTNTRSGNGITTGAYLTVH
jgi:putative transposase